MGSDLGAGVSDLLPVSGLSSDAEFRFLPVVLKSALVFLQTQGRCWVKSLW